MKRYLPALTALTISLIGIAFTPSLRASESDEKTVITISGAVTIQGTLLQPGSYVLKLQDTQSSQDMVFVFNADETRLIALVRAIPAYRLQPSDKSELRFYNAPAGEPAALHTWFYPGESIGFEFRP